MPGCLSGFVKCGVLDTVLQRLHLPIPPISWPGEILLAHLSSAVVWTVASATLLYGQPCPGWHPESPTKPLSVVEGFIHAATPHTSMV